MFLDFRELLLINLYSNKTAFCISNNCIYQLSETHNFFFRIFKMVKKSELEIVRKEIIGLYKRKFTTTEMVKHLKHHQCGCKLVCCTIKCFKETGDEIPPKRPGRKRVVCTKKFIKVIRERIRWNPARSGRSIAKEFGTNSKTIRNLIKTDLGMKACKKQSSAGLTNKNKLEHVKRCKMIKKRHGGPPIIFFDEKLFLLERPLNIQND